MVHSGTRQYLIQRRTRKLEKGNRFENKHHIPTSHNCHHCILLYTSDSILQLLLLRQPPPTPHTKEEWTKVVFSKNNGSCWFMFLFHFSYSDIGSPKVAAGTSILTRCRCTLINICPIEKQYIKYFLSTTGLHLTKENEEYITRRNESHVWWWSWSRHLH